MDTITNVYIDTVFCRCECGNCAIDLLAKPEESRCCMEIQGCRDQMFPFETDESDKCIMEHPALSLKTKGRRNYASVFREGQKTRAE